jgi:hypothetical protein
MRLLLLRDGYKAVAWSEPVDLRATGIEHYHFNDYEVL